MSVQNKRSTVTLYSHPKCPYSHRVRIILAEKGVHFDVIDVDLDDKPDALLELNPYGTVPTLMDRDLVAYESEVIFEYLEERFPHPPLLTVFPIERAQTRYLAKRIDKDWTRYLVTALFGKTEEVVYNAKVALVKELLSMIPAFTKHKHFMQEKYSIIDCMLSVILYRLPELGITLPPRAEPIIDYAERVFSRPSFQHSIGNVEEL
ncbi:glutathione S-transferase N-terminal domain-containing protein [Francisellaceae bacterium]|nr:glutathione S-transferase N-terminal domain-containing protein [Francisellaceae bacterium]